MKTPRSVLLVLLGLVLIGGCVESGVDDATDEGLETDESVSSLTLPYTLRVTLAAQSGVTGVQRVNFAVPLPAGVLTDPNLTRVQTTAGVELPAARRALATHPDGSLRSVQLQVDVNPATVTAVDVQLGVAATAPPLSLAEVSTTLLTPDGTT